MSQMRWFRIDGVTLRVAQDGAARQLVARPGAADGEIAPDVADGLRKAGFVRLPGQAVFVRPTGGLTVGVLRAALGERVSEVQADSAEVLGEAWPGWLPGVAALQARIQDLDAMGLEPTERGERVVLAVAEVIGGDGVAQRAAASRWRRFAEAWSTETDAAAIAEAVVEDVRVSLSELDVPALDAAVPSEADARARLRAWSAEWLGTVGDLDAAEERAHDAEAIVGPGFLGTEVWERIATLHGDLKAAKAQHAERLAAMDAWQPWSGEGADPPPREDLDLIPGSDRWRRASVGGRLVWSHPLVVDLGTAPIDGIEDAADPTAASRGDAGWLLPAPTEALYPLTPLATRGAGKAATVAFGYGKFIELVNRPIALHLLARYPGGEFCVGSGTFGRAFYLHQGEVIGVVATTRPDTAAEREAISTAAAAGMRRRVTAELARGLRFGDVLIDDKGGFWQAQDLRGFVLRAKQISNDQVIGDQVGFLLDPERADAYPWLAATPLFVMGRVWRGEERGEPYPLAYLPDAYHEAMVRWQAHRLRGGLESARALFDTQRQRAVHEAAWAKAVDAAVATGTAVSMTLREARARVRDAQSVLAIEGGEEATLVTEGARVRFVPSSEHRLKYANREGVATPIEGVAIAVDRTSGGHVRVRLRTDEDAHQGGGKLERIVYSHEGTLETVSAAEPVAPSVPEGVQRQVEGALARLREGFRELAEIERVTGRYSAEQAFERITQAPAITGAERVLSEFIERAPDNGVDAEAFIAGLGGRPDLTVFAPKPAQAAPAATEAGASTSADPRSVNAMMGLDGYTEAEAAALSAAGFRKSRAKDNIGEWNSPPFDEGKRRLRVFKIGQSFVGSVNWGAAWKQGRDVAIGDLESVLTAFRTEFAGALQGGTSSAPDAPDATAEAVEPTSSGEPPRRSEWAMARSVSREDGTYLGVPEGCADDALHLAALARIEPAADGWRAVLLPEETQVAVGDRSAVESGLAAELDALAEGEAEHYTWADGSRSVSLLPISPARWRATGQEGAWPEDVDVVALWQDPDGRRSEAGRREALQPSAELAAGGVLRVDTWTLREDNPAATRQSRRGKGRIEDFGEKIGGARKDLARLRGARLMVSDTEDWTDDERRDLVTKDRIWPAPNWAARLKDGMEPAVAFALKMVRDSIRSGWAVASRGRRYVWNRAGAEEWHAAVADLGETFDAVTTREEFQDALRQFVVCTQKGSWTRTSFTERGNAVERAGRRGHRSTLFELGALAREPDSAEGAAAIKDGWDWVERKRVRERWPECVAARVARRRGGPEVIEVRPQLEGVERVGPDYRAGSNVTPERMLETFGLRGGEWGEWTSQADRQQTLNHAFDALMDLSAIMDIPPAAIGLGGELAVAFGARGTGGRRAAAAHYEPYRRVINLTKMAGAGSLAHEFGHALDDHLGRVSGVRGTTRHMLLSEWVAGEMPLHGLHPPLRAAITTLVMRLQMRPETDAERVARAHAQQSGCERMIALAPTNLGYVRQAAEYALPRLVGGEGAKGVLQTLDSAIGVMLAASAGGHESWKRLPTSQVFAEVLGALACARKACGSRERVEPDWFERLRKTVVDLNSAHAWLARASVNGPVVGEERWYTSDYYRAALNLDESRSKAYWSTTIELFARAFESWCFDTLAKKGWRSDYLVHGVEPSRYAPAEGESNRNAYPSGSEREALNGCFTELASSLRTELNADGRMRLFARGGLLPDRGLSTGAVNALVEPIRRALSGRVDVAVVQSVDELPIDSPSDVRGAFTPDPPTAWLVADNLASGLDVERTLAHEVLRHAGLWRVLGREREDVLTEIWASNPRVRTAVDALRRESLADGVPLSRTDATEEVLAGFADHGELGQVRGIDRLIAAMRDLLRKLGFGRVVGAWSDEDVGYVLDRAERAMPWPRKPALGAHQEQEAAHAPLMGLGLGNG